MVTIFGSLVGAGRIADFVRARGTLQANMLVGVFLALLWIPFHFLLFLAPTSRWAVARPWLYLRGRSIRNRARRHPADDARVHAWPGLRSLSVHPELGIGPSAVAILCTQYLFRRDAAVNYSLLLVSVTACLLAAALLASGLKPFLKSLDRLRNWSAESA
jgi:hypothetical protein